MAQPTLDAPDLSLSDFRALREGRDLPEKVNVSTSEAETGDQPGNAESADGPETSGDTEVSPEPKNEQPPDKENPPAPGKRALVDDVGKLRRDNRALQERLAALEASPKPATLQPAEVKPAAEATDDEPDVQKYDDFVNWQKDWTRWDRRQADKQASLDREQAAKQTAANEHAQRWQERQGSARVKYADYDTVALEKSLPVTNAMGAAITDSELGAEILYHLGQNPDEAARISKLSNLAQAREIGKLELKLAAPPEGSGNAGEDELETETRTDNVVSKAPAPAPRPQSGKLSKPNPVRNLNSMTQAEYREYRESGKIR